MKIETYLKAYSDNGKYLGAVEGEFTSGKIRAFLELWEKAESEARLKMNLGGQNK